MPERLTLTVAAIIHPDAVRRDDPSRDRRQIGFKVTTTLTPTIRAFSTLQEKFRLEQYVKDKYWTSTRRDADSDEWNDGKEQGSLDDWVLDSFGFDDAQGEWRSDQTETVFVDEPGFIGKDRRHGQALPKTQRLGYYEISFHWRVTRVSDGSTYKTATVTLKADPDDENRVVYKVPTSKITWEFDL